MEFHVLRTTFALSVWVLICNSVEAGPPGTVWDARTDYIKGIDQTIDSNDPWSYRNAESPPWGNSYGQFLVWNAAGLGSDAAYTGCFDPINCSRPVLTGDARYGCGNKPLSGPDCDPMDEQLGGHGAYMIRWTSPIDGAIRVEGYVYQGDSSDRRLTNWKLLKNSSDPDEGVMTEGFTKLEGEIPQNFYKNRVSFEEGSHGTAGVYTTVDFGDTIDLVTLGTLGWGCCSGAVNVVYRIHSIDPSEIPEPEIWNAREDFVEGLDQSLDPNAPWSYHNGEPGEEYGDLLVWNAPGQWGSGPAYTSCLDCEARPVLTGQASFITNPAANDPFDEQIGGHGSYMLRWTNSSDTGFEAFDGWVQIEGYIYQSPSSDGRLATWQILKNDRVVNSGTTLRASDGTPLSGYENRVGFERGRSGLRGTFIEVSAGDTIDLITPGTPGFGCCPPGVNTKYAIRKVNAISVPTDQDAWDATIDFVGGLDQTVTTNDPWSYRSGEADNYGNLLVWNPAGQFGSDAAYTACLACETRPVLAGAMQFDGFDPLNEQFGGHGNFMVRWTSPINGTVAVDGFIYQTPIDAEGSRTNWQLLKNDEIFTQGFTPVDTDGISSLNGYDNRVNFSDGDGGRTATFVDVRVGDRIDFITPGTDGFDNATPSGVNATLRLTRVPGSTTLTVAPDQNSGVLSWTPVRDGATFTTDGYNVIQTSPLPERVVNEAPVTGTKLTIVGLESGIEYCYVVEAIASDGRLGAPSNEACVVPTQDTRNAWDARIHWVDGLDQAASPNLPWSYRSAEAPPVGDSYGDLLVWNEAGQGSSPAYTLCLDCQLRPVFAGSVQFSGFDEFNEQVGGHGAYMLRWTSPISGVVKVEGYIYQAETQSRLTNWKILRNDAVFTEGFTGFDEFGPLNGYDNRVFFDTGSGGLRRTFIPVKPGDNIDLITPGDDTSRFGEIIGAGCNTMYRILRVDPSEVPTVAYWDAREDFLGGFDQTRVGNDPWSYRSAEPDAYGELLVWNPAGQWGSSSAYMACLDDCGRRPVLAGSVQFGGQDPQNEQFGGHGAFMVRWTSPIDGAIGIEGYIYQTPVPTRLTHWQFLKNGVPFWEGFTASDEFGPFNGYENRVFFEEGRPPEGGGGAAGLDGLSVQVRVGDTIDFITPGDPLARFGESIGAGVNARLRYTPQEVSGGGFRRADCDQSGKVDFNDAIFHLRFLFLGENEEIVNSCKDACDADDSGTDDFTDDINTLKVLFLGQGEIPAPGPMPDESHPCGTDPTIETPEELTCETYAPKIACP